MALVIFIALAFVAIAASLWFYMQYSAVREAGRANQQDFAGIVGKVFDQQEGWELRVELDAEYDFRYGSQAYGAVADQLGKAVVYDGMNPLLGWENPGAVQDALGNSVVQGDLPEPYVSVKSLLSHYENKYREHKQLIADLESKLAARRDEVGEKVKALAALRTELMDTLNEAINEYARNMDELRSEFDGMQNMYQAATAKTDEWRQKLDVAQNEWQAKEATLRQDAERYKELYDKLRRGEKIEETMQAKGKVLELQRARGLLVLEGGQDAGIELNSEFIVYSETRAGVRTRKGVVVVNQVKDLTALAIIGKQDEMMLVGDLFVSREVWDRFHGPRVVTPEVGGGVVP